MRTRRSHSSSDPVSLFFGKEQNKPKTHTPVLLHEAVELLALQSNDVVLDATLGGSGHAHAVAEKLGKKGVFIGFDLDPDAIPRAEKALTGMKPSVYLVHANFRHLADELRKLKISFVTKVLFDLGWSAYQLDSGRGFSFLADEPLVMTYDHPKTGQLTAEKIVNEWGEESLADIIFGWGEERYSRRIAKAIIERRAERPFKTSKELAEVIKESVPAFYGRGRSGRSGLHPATRTFQALRIAVNDELGALKEGLRAAWEMLPPEGRIAVITFHSIEDRLVKQTFAEWKKIGEGVLLSKKPLGPTAKEVQENPRARSAKLRVIQKTTALLTTDY